MSIYSRILILVVAFFAFSCEAQSEFKYKEIENLRIYVDESDAVFLPAELLSKNPEKNLSTINSFLKVHPKVQLPDLDIFVAKEGIDLNDFNTLIFGRKTRVIIEPNELIRYEILRIHNVKNVTVLNPTIVGDRQNHLGTDGEWGHGISILGSENVRVVNFDVRNCWGDGLYIGKFKKLNFSQDVVLKDGFLDFNRRNAISITSAKNVKISNLVASNTYGTLPMYGFDIEPNNEHDEIDDIIIKNLKTFNNFEGGLGIFLHKMKKANQKEVKIEVQNFENSKSKRGLFLSQNLNEFKGLRGGVTMNNIKFVNTLEPIYMRKQENKSFLIKIQNLELSGNDKLKKSGVKMVGKYNRFENVNISFNEN